jgi:hypothetical protein
MKGTLHGIEHAGKFSTLRETYPIKDHLLACSYTLNPFGMYSATTANQGPDLALKNSTIQHKGQMIEHPQYH